MASHSSILAWRIPWTEEPGEAAVLRVTESDTAERLTDTPAVRKYMVLNLALRL